MDLQVLSRRIAREVRNARLAARDRTYGWPEALDAALDGSRVIGPYRSGVRRRAQDVPVDRLLLGDLHGLRADVFARRIGDPLWPSTRLGDSPFAWLYGQIVAGADDDVLVDETAPYGAFARRVIDEFGAFRGCTTDGDLRTLVGGLRDDFTAGGAAAVPIGSGADRPVVRPIRDSGHFQIVSGHHRLGALAATGHDRVEVDIAWAPAVTPVQQQVRRLKWMRGSTELYQPVDAPELTEKWSLGRRCDDRLAMMTTKLDDLAITGGTYLDVASSYGWFVAHMAELGFAAEGVEIDGECAVLGEMVYGLPRSAITVGDARSLLRFSNRTWDVVSCFSVVHQVIRAQGRDAGVALIEQLDKVTGRVLFFDMGERHEGWDRAAEIGWTPDEIEKVFREVTSFSNVERLGTDSDSGSDYRGGVGRTLFAFTR